ncbi:MAG: hypothetical protein WAP99_04990 [Caldicoprobacterales bacterium]|jgi:hypothetical protein
MTYKEYEEKCNGIRKKNQVYLDEFKEDLIKAGLKEKTIKRHYTNVNFYINTYLLREEPMEMIKGTYSLTLNMFFGYFFIRKCTWSTPSTIKSTAASIKKFYKSMLQRGYIDEMHYEEVIDTFDEDMDDWISDCEAYNDLDSADPFFEFL